MEQSTVEWTPKNGERVWVKVFSNWSLGTYIGFDTIENKHLVREDAEGGGHLMASSQVLPESANPNALKQLTAVEWYIKKIKEARQMCDDASMEMDIWHTLDVLIGKGEQAKEMEDSQATEYAKWSMDISQLTGRFFTFLEWIKDEPKNDDNL